MTNNNSEEMDIDNITVRHHIIEHVPHFGDLEKKRCYDILKDILATDELEQSVPQLLKKRRREKNAMITVPKPNVEIKTEDSGVASSIMSNHDDSSTNTSSTELVDAILPEEYKQETFDFKDTYKGPFWEVPLAEHNGIYLVMVNTRKGETWVQARLIKTNGPVCLVRIINTQKPAKVYSQFFAITEEPRMFLRIGQRVIAPFRRNADTGEVAKGRKTYKLGTVTEYPAVENNHRYLIFFDSGYWSYVDMESVRPLLYYRKHVWRDVPGPYKFVLQMYLEGHFQPMKHFECGETAKIVSEKVGKQKREFWKRNTDNFYKVLNVDCSLIALYHRVDRTTFFMHRGYPFLVKIDI